MASLKLYLRDAVLEFKCINGIVPTYLSVHFYRRRLRSGRTTRQSNDSDIPKFRTTTGQKVIC